MRIACMLLVIFAAACSGDEVDSGIATCSGEVYDQCGSEHDCTSNDCRVFGEVQGCTQPCSEATPCPDDDDGNAVTCNAGGICEPTLVRACVQR